MGRRKMRRIFLLLQCVYHIPAPLTMASDEHLRHSSSSSNKRKAKEQHYQNEERRLIIDGLDAREGEFPFYVYYENYWGFSRCGGTLLSPTRVLTAAHCLTQLFGVKVPSEVQIGNTNLSNGETVKVDCASIHPNFLVGGGDMDNRAVYYDFAILKLASPASTTSFVTLNSDPNYPSAPGQDLTTMGFGVTNNFWPRILGPFSLPATARNRDTLKKKPSNLLPAATCQEESKCINSDYHICTNSGVCYGDSGGPLLDSDNVQVGVLSFGASDICSSSNRAVIFGNVASVYDWIQNELESDSCDDCFTFTFESPCPVAGTGCSDSAKTTHFGFDGMI